MSLHTKIRRLVNLYKLLWVKDEVDSLRAEVAELRSELDGLRLSARAELEYLRLVVRDDMDLLKSSLEVPRHLFDDLREWRARTPIPREPLVSVCVATYNRARLLMERSIPSVLSQTYPHFELIVVGDGCTDETAELIAKVGDPRLKFVNLPNRGSYPAEPLNRWLVAGTQAINHGMSLAQGDYVTHLDDDDEYLPERLEKLVTFAVAKECDLVWHPFWMENPDNQWYLLEAPVFAFGHVTTASVLYRSWFTKIEWNVEAYRLIEPGDWNRYRRIKYLGPVSQRYPEPLLRHYRQQTQMEQKPRVEDIE
jgi:hypothetical protein